MWDVAMIPKVGVSVFHRWAAGGTLTIDGARSGGGLIPADAIADATEMTQENGTLSIASYESIDSGVKYKVVLNPTDEHHVVHQIGIWGHLDDGESTLLALYQDDYGLDVPAKTDMPEFRYEFYALIAMDNKGDLVVTIDSSLAVTRGELDEMAEAIHESLARVKEDLEERLEDCRDQWHHGTGITGTDTEGCVFVDSGVEAAREGDFFFNTDTGNVYRCTVAGAAKTAKWVYEGNIRGTGGAGWPTGGVPLGAAWYTGTGVTGTSPDGTAFPGSGVENAAIGECYLNIMTGNVYKCVSGGDAKAALWQYVLCLRGPEGEAGLQGNVNVSFGTVDLEDGVSRLETGLMYFVYEGAEAARLSLPMESLIGVPLSSGAVPLAAAVASASEAYTVWYDGEGITGTPGVGTAYPGSGVAAARVGDFYKNASGRLYRCVQGGDPSTALWVFLMDLRGQTGPKGLTGGLYVAVGTDDLTPGESELEAGKFYFVYDGQGAVSEARSWYANAPVAASEDAGDSAYNQRGSVATYAALPDSPKVGDVYDVADTGMNYRWDGSRWDELGAKIDVASEEEADAVLNDVLGK